ncbi:MAG TPA: recombination mediator RecR [Candidatus Acidoferrum sp.]|nr:recombination mediator RecR [Candidatus Acidoferrum sp.]
MSDPIQRLVRELARLPGVGERTATRLAFHLVRRPESQLRELAAALLDVVDKIHLCTVCMNLTDRDPCNLCTDARRDSGTLCVVATPAELLAIERAGHYSGRYHVLHGLLSPLDGVGPDDLRIAELLRRVEPAVAGDTARVQEVIVATSANVEGEATALYLARLIKPLGVAVTRIASGIPVGGELEYSDQATIARALAGRSPL